MVTNGDESERHSRPFVSIRGLSLLVGFFLACTHMALGQAPLSDLVFAVGTTARDAASNNWAYLLIGTPSPDLLAGKQFAVFGKDGDPTSANTFTRRGTMARQTSTAAIDALLSQSTALGQNLASLSDSLNLLLRRVPGITNQSLASKVLTALQTAPGDPNIGSMLEMMEKANPGLSMCMGRAFAEQITTVTTYELRELDPRTGTAGDVVGRATVTPGSPILLPAPSRPVVVSALSTPDRGDDLRVRLRWATPDPLRRLSLASYGFNVWRIGFTQAVAGNFHKVAPTLAQLYGNTNFIRVNDAAIQADPLTDAAAGNPADTRTTFFSDDNGRSLGLPPFRDGDRFVYYATARDILGHDGLVSPPATTQVCRRKPPQAPTSLAVRDEALTDAGGSVQQRFRITWSQNTDTNDAVTQYWVYRWTDPSFAFTNDVTSTSNRVGIVQQLAGTNANSFLDTNANSPGIPGPSVYWYTVRSILEGACGPLPSAHSAPASGVLRERSGPDAPTGGVLGSCGTPVVAFSNITRIDFPDFDPSLWQYRFSCDRRDSSVAWVQFFATNSQGIAEAIGPIYFEADETRLDADYSVPLNDRVLAVTCIVGTAYDQVSRPASYTIITTNVFGRRTDVSFYSGTVLLTAAQTSDPLVAALNSGPTEDCAYAYDVQVDPSGTVTLRFPLHGPITIRSTSNDINFAEVGVAFPEFPSTYSVSYPACLTGPLPRFFACPLNLPGDGSCVEHVARASDDGPVAPVVLHFIPTPRTREYRVYRQVAGGTMTMISQGRTRYNPLNATRRIVVRDDVMPPASARLCYFVQVFDENGNASPLASLGCREAQPPAPPRPVLAEPVSAGTVAQPQVTLNWYCPTAGVSRFRFLIKRVDKQPDPSPLFGRSAIGFTSTLLAIAQPTRYTTSSIRTRLRKSTTSAAANLIKPVTVDEGQLTPTLSSGFGPGPQFTLTADILANATYQITVQALNSRDQAGPVSEMWEFTWRPPTVVQSVPWPARSLPRVADFDTAPVVPAPPYSPRVRAVLFTNEQVLTGGFQDNRFPVGIRIGELERDPNRISYVPNVGTTNPVTYSFFGFSFFGSGVPIDPNAYIFRRASSDASRRGESLLPIVVYRQQVTNAAYPRLSGDLVQVSPMIDQISANIISTGDSGVYVLIPDRLIALRRESYSGTDHPVLYLRDQQPVLYSARYRYFVVRFKSNREVDQVIPAGEIEIPREPCDGCDVP